MCFGPTADNWAVHQPKKQSCINIKIHVGFINQNRYGTRFNVDKYTRSCQTFALGDCCLVSASIKESTHKRHNGSNMTRWSTRQLHSSYILRLVSSPRPFIRGILVVNSSPFVSVLGSYLMLTLHECKESEHWDKTVTWWSYFPPGW